MEQLTWLYYLVQFIEQTTLPPQLHQELKVAQHQLLYQESVCDVGNSQNLENAAYYHIEKQDCFARPENDSDSQYALDDQLHQ